MKLLARLYFFLILKLMNNSIHFIQNIMYYEFISLYEWLKNIYIIIFSNIPNKKNHILIKPKIFFLNLKFMWLQSVNIYFNYIFLSHKRTTSEFSKNYFVLLYLILEWIKLLSNLKVMYQGHLIDCYLYSVL